MCDVVEGEYWIFFEGVGMWVFSGGSFKDVVEVV